MNGIKKTVLHLTSRTTGCAFNEQKRSLAMTQLTNQKEFTNSLNTFIYFYLFIFPLILRTSKSLSHPTSCSTKTSRGWLFHTTMIIYDRCQSKNLEVKKSNKVIQKMPISKKKNNRRESGNNMKRNKLLINLKNNN